MRNFRGVLRVIASAIGLVLASGTGAFAANVVFNTDTGIVTVDGVPTTGLNGTSFTTSVSGNIRIWEFQGDLTIGAGDAMTGVGSRGASLQALNNANIAPGATINFSAAFSSRQPTFFR